MRYFKIALIIITGLLISVGLLTLWYVNRVAPDYEGTVNSRFIQKDVAVYTDSLGVPHIYAQNEEDAFFALGYVQAQERLFQMELLRRVGSGRLAEMFGKDLLHVDKFFRTLGIHSKAKETAATWDTIQAPWKNTSLKYIEGINAFISENTLPAEFILLGIEPEKFTPTDLYLITGYMAFSFAEAFRNDPILSTIGSKLGSNYLEVFDVKYQADPAAVDTTTQAMLENLSELSIQIEQHLPVASWIGSNGWVVSPQRSSSGKALFANDTHIGYQQPCVWYEAHLNYPGMEIYGHFLAGIPFPLTGHTLDHAWGLTMFENDDINLYTETLGDNETYMYKGTTLPIQIHTDTIRIKNEDPVVITIRNTIHGPMVNELIPHLPDSAETTVSVWWSYLHLPSNAPEVTYNLMKASTLEAGRSAAKMVNAPGLNILYANKDGDIACWSAGKIPFYESHLETRLLLDGASGKNDPLYFLDFSKNPQIENPPGGIIISANQAHRDPEGTIFCTGYYAPDDRLNRIKHLLDKQKLWSIEQFKSIQCDVTSDVQAAIAKSVAILLEKQSLSGIQSEALHRIASWNGRHKAEDVAPLIWYTTLAYILELAMEDELGEFNHSVFVNTHLMKSSYKKFIDRADSPWWDNVNTKHTKESRDEIILLSYTKAIEQLTKNYGSQVSDWTWGSSHTLTHGHPLGKVKPLGYFLNVGPFPAPGGIETINNAGFPMYTGELFSIKYGAAMRNLVDMGDPMHAWSMLPTGQSGHVGSVHYSDQAESYVNGQYRYMLMSEAEIKQNSDKRLIFTREDVQ